MNAVLHVADGGIRALISVSATEVTLHSWPPEDDSLVKDIIPDFYITAKTKHTVALVSGQTSSEACLQSRSFYVPKKVSYYYYVNWWEYFITF